MNEVVRGSDSNSHILFIVHLIKESKGGKSKYFRTDVSKRSPRNGIASRVADADDGVAPLVGVYCVEERSKNVPFLVM